jgi:NADP-dependent 3-hydroxy acid dehydrogenase YdfG
MKTNIENKVILITGASSGIGEATARLLGGKGARVLLGARRTGHLEKIVAEIRASGGSAECQTLDVTSLDDTKAFAAFARDTFGPSTCSSTMPASCRSRRCTKSRSTNGIA